MKSFEKELPQGYRKAMTVDAKGRRLGILLNLAATVVILVMTVGLYCLIRPKNFFEEYDPVRNLVLVAALFAYLVLHELAHGAAYWLLTRQKLTFGLTLTVAYCGVPQIFVYRRTALIALLTPFVLFTVLFGILTAALQNPWDQMLAGFMLSVHVGGCVGDLYDTFLYGTRFRNPQTLMRDTGPMQEFYLPKA